MGVAEYKQVPVDSIDLPAREMRTYVTEERLNELVESIKQVGILQPLRLKEKGDRYEVVFGVRRLMAARAAGLASVPAVVATAGDKLAGVEMLHENIIREDVSPVDLGRWLAELKARERLTLEDLGARFGRSRTWAEQYIALTRCDAEIQAAVEAGRVDMVSGRRLQQVRNRERRLNLLEHAVRSGASQNTISSWVAKEQVREGKRPAAPPVSGALDQARPSEELTFTCVWCLKQTPQEKMILARFCGPCYTDFKQAVIYEQEKKHNGNQPVEDTGPHNGSTQDLGDQAGETDTVGSDQGARLGPEI